jgi:ABC-2 type transport system permease protein
MKALGRYATLFVFLCRMSLMRQMAYRPHFFLMVLGKVIRMLLLLLFFQAVFFKVDALGRWTFDQVLLLFATFHMVDYLMSITFQRNLSYHLPALIQNGNLDSRMILPVNLLFLASLESIDMMDLFSFIPCIGLLAYALHRLEFEFTWLQALMYGLLVMNALVFLFAVVLIVAAISFWTTQSAGLGRIFDDLTRIGRYPLDIFEGFWKFFFIYVLPLALIAQTPSQALLGTLAPGFVLYAFVFSSLLAIIAVGFWKMGLRTYSSTSS